ncbi:MAG: hydroxymethylglutaryl-CoA lyase [Deltaproteobacteria bacterium]|nr:hydroxymethylglutaryl-CoA lyase [Deltaproteobacteria bacterium]
MTLPTSVRIREVGAREGFQTLQTVVSTAQKLELIAALSETGVREIEITAMVRADKVPQMSDAEEVIRQFVRKPGVRYTALYLNPRGFVRAEETNRLDNEGWLYGAVSETFLKKNANVSVAESIQAIPEWLTAFASRGKKPQGLMLSTAFGCNYEGSFPDSKVLQVIRSSIEKVEQAGSQLPEVCLADTMGRATPEMLKRLVGAVRAQFPSLYVSLHLHDTRGSGMANVYAGLEMGVDCFDTSVGGMGGCPFAKGAAGNVCSEDVAYLCEEMGIATNVNLDAYCRAARLAERIVGTPLPGKLYKSCT